MCRSAMRTKPDPNCELRAHGAYMASSRIARRHVLNDVKQVAVIYPASRWEVLMLPGHDVVRAYRPHHAIGFMNPSAWQVFNTPV